MIIRDKRIVVCKRCQGSGNITVSTGKENEYEIASCPECNGARVLERCITIEYKKIKDANESKKECTAVEVADGHR